VAINNGVEELDSKIRLLDAFELPPFLAYCESLRVLRLRLVLLRLK
jgi:hypothetical protein